MESESLLQEPTACVNAEPYESNPSRPILFLFKGPFNIAAQARGPV
jgi:hypothetical protein